MRSYATVTGRWDTRSSPGISTTYDNRWFDNQGTAGNTV